MQVCIAGAGWRLAFGVVHLALQCSLAVVFVRSSMVKCSTTHACGEAHAIVGFDSISLCRAMSFSDVVDMSSGDCEVG